MTTAVDAETKEAARARLRRIAGQAQAIERMLDNITRAADLSRSSPLRAVFTPVVHNVNKPDQYAPAGADYA